ncbi:MAG: tetratricopeptide repeat protein [Bacteroidales bacterium]|nr:tetratricopeptide repeat protein [Bacteroidales bacterium]
MKKSQGKYKKSNHNVEKEQPFPFKNVFYVLFIIFITLFIYRNSVHHDFVNWDDKQTIIENPNIKDFNVESVGYLFKESYHTDYRPLTYTLYALIYKFWGMNPKPYHTVNLFLHILNIILVFGLIRLLTKKDFISFIVAFIFAIHPMHVESVAWVSAFNDVLYAFLFLISIIFYIFYLKKGRLKIYLTLSLVFFILSCFSKPLAIVLPFVLLLIDYHFKRKFDKLIFVEKLPYIFIMGSFVFLTIWARKDDIASTAVAYSIFERLIFASYAFNYYIFSFIFPFKLSSVHAYPTLNESGFYPIIYYLSPILSCIFLCLPVFIKKIRNEYLFGFLFFLINIFIILQLIPFGNNSIIAERYTYISYIGLALILGLILQSVANSVRIKQELKTLYLSLFFLYGLFLSYTAFTYQKVWQNSITLWNNVLELNPENVMALNSRAEAKYEINDFNGALEDLSNSIRIDSSNHKIYSNRGLIYYQMKDFDAALNDFNSALKFDSNNYFAYYNQGKVFSEIGKTDEAINSLSRAIEIDSTYTNAYNERAYQFFNTGNYEMALADFNSITALEPFNESAYINKSNIEIMLEDNEAAFRSFEKAIHINPENHVAFTNRGLLYYNLNKPDNACRDWNVALSLGNQQALRMFNQFCL